MSSESLSKMQKGKRDLIENGILNSILAFADDDTTVAKRQLTCKLSDFYFRHGHKTEKYMPEMVALIRSYLRVDVDYTEEQLETLEMLWVVNIKENTPKSS